MAPSDDLASFLQNTLLRYDPTLDVSEGSHAYMTIIQPVLDRFSDDPFNVDLSVFIHDRLAQEFPELATDSGGFLDDVLAKPLQMLLEPFKRESQLIHQNQSVENADLMGEAEADALAANFFESRESGNYATCPVRLYFNSPVSISVTTERRVYTDSGLNYYPVDNYIISATQMMFNREGNQYYLDIVVRAEAPGSDYNVSKGSITNIDDTPGVVKVSNLTDVTDGQPTETNAEFLARTANSLTERSLVTRRGIAARAPMDILRAINVVGAGDVGMDRDILRGTGEGFLHRIATAVVFGNWIYPTASLFTDRGPGGDYIVEVGDVVRFQPTGSTTVFSANITQILVQAAVSVYILNTTWDISPNTSGSLVVLKPGFITISETPGGISSIQTVPDGEIHLGGHTDVFVRPRSDSTQQAVLSNLTDNQPLVTVPGTTNSYAAINAGTNLVSLYPDTLNLAAVGVKAGDTLVVETSPLAGTYRIVSVGTPDRIHQLRVDAVFAAGPYTTRARIIDSVHVDLVEPKIMKLPFDTSSVTDLQTTVGSNVFRFATVSLGFYGVGVGDTIRILSGRDAGDYTITAFNTAGGAIVDRTATQSAANLPYQIFALSSGVERPLVRIKNIEVLDATSQNTGITVPYGDAVDIRTTSVLEGAGKDVKVYDRHVFVFPDLHGIWDSLTPAPLVPGAGNDTRYSQGVVPYNGVVMNIGQFDAANPIRYAEQVIPPFSHNSKRDTLLALPMRKDPSFTSDPTGDHHTSDLAEAKIGDSLIILDGMNQGSYLIKNIQIIDAWGIAANQHGHQKAALVQVEPELPVDPIRNLIEFATAHAQTFTAQEFVDALAWVGDWDSASGWYVQTFLPKVRAALADVGIALTTGETKEFVDALCRSGYSVGPSAKGVVRAFFQSPASLELSYGETPTRLVDLTDSAKKFRLDPSMPPAQIYPEAEEETDPSEWLRNLVPIDPPAGSPGVYIPDDSIALKGLRTGDGLEIYPAINDMPVKGTHVSSWLCTTQAGSNVVTVLASSSLGHRTAIKTGQIFCIDSGPDAGMYRVTEVVHDDLAGTTSPDVPVIQFKVDRPLTWSTLPFPYAEVSGARPSLLMTAIGFGITAAGADCRLSCTGFSSMTTADWITVYAAFDESSPSALTSDLPYIGTFRVLNVVGGNTAVLDRAAFPAANKRVLFVVHGAPSSTPATTQGGGTVISDFYVRCRMYDSVPLVRTVTVPWGDVATIQSNGIVTIESSIATTDTFMSYVGQQSYFSHKSPYRITRAGVFRTSSTRMSTHRDRGLYYVDFPIVGYGPSSNMNITSETPLGLLDGFDVEGYRLVVDNKLLTFSVQEQVSIVLPAAVLPVGSESSQDNKIRLSGQSLQITYDNAPAVNDMQSLLGSPQDRVTAENVLVRHFLPAYVYIDASYVGGGAPEDVAKQIIDYINNIPPDSTQLRADEVEGLIKRRNAQRVNLPLVLVALVHGNDRKIRALRSENFLGVGQSIPFDGTFSQMYFIAGQDSSKDSPRPDVEQVYLIRY